MPPQWSPGLWTYQNGYLRTGPAPDDMMIAVVHGRTPEEADANGVLIRAAPEAARLLAAAYPHVPLPLREQIYAWFSSVGVTLEDLGGSGPLHGAT